MAARGKSERAGADDGRALPAPAQGKRDRQQPGNSQGARKT